MQGFFGPRVFKLGYNEGLETAARHCEMIARLAASVREVDCSTEVVYALWRAEEIRALKSPLSTQVARETPGSNSSAITH